MVSAILKKAATIKSTTYNDGKRRKPIKVVSSKLESKFGALVKFIEKQKVNLNRKIRIMKVEGSFSLMHMWRWPYGE
ncbi:hypothetical protein BBJ28_00014944 [Nothophytophthora sp. Chile5]|nr:hypothetical protein BBJ28_00014944 [Nothophytophthora sp. Chile5]